MERKFHAHRVRGSRAGVLGSSDEVRAHELDVCVGSSWTDDLAERENRDSGALVVFLSKTHELVTNYLLHGSQEIGPPSVDLTELHVRVARLERERASDGARIATLERERERVRARLATLERTLGVGETTVEQTDPIKSWSRSNRSLAAEWAGHYIAVTRSGEVLDHDAEGADLYARLQDRTGIDFDNILIGRLP